MAHIGLVCIGEGTAVLKGERMTGAEALRRLDLAPLVLEGKEGLSLVNGTACVSGMGSIALSRLSNLMEWVTAISAMTFENLGGQQAVFDPRSLALRKSGGLQEVGKGMNRWLASSDMLRKAQGARTQDGLSLRTIPQLHGAGQEIVDELATVVNEELASVTDNPALGGTPDASEVFSQAHPLAIRMALKSDSCAMGVVTIASMSESRVCRLLDPEETNLPAFLAADPGADSGLMIAQYTARGLVAESRRLAMPASLDGGSTSGRQEDFLAHATPAVMKLLHIIDNAEYALAIELVATTQAYGLRQDGTARGPKTDELLSKVRARLPLYRDDRPLSDTIEAAVDLLRNTSPR
ncbi:MAG: aromatic amino acid lyase [Burkholderiaceae bacterium]